MKRDLSDFQWYRGINDHRRYLAGFVSDGDAEQIGQRSHLWEMFGRAMCLGVMHLASTDQWIVIKVDQRNNRLMSLDAISVRRFKRDYQLMEKQDYLVK